jgi:hypothetical protein
MQSPDSFGEALALRMISLSADFLFPILTWSFFSHKRMFEFEMIV